jgi:endogenous inhibitor of DNA gyrase (YacG/DUF329 family)
MYEAKCPTCGTAVNATLEGPLIPGTEYHAYCPKCSRSFFGVLIPKSPEPPKSPG